MGGHHGGILNMAASSSLCDRSFQSYQNPEFQNTAAYIAIKILSSLRADIPIAFGAT